MRGGDCNEVGDAYGRGRGKGIGGQMGGESGGRGKREDG